MTRETPVLSIRNLKTYFYLEERVVKAVDGISLDARKGRITALVGGSGSGKSITSLSVFNLVDAPGRIVDGEILLNGVNLRGLGEKRLRRIRGREIAMIFQEPAGSMDPVMTVKNHLFEVLRTHNRRAGKTEAMDMARAALARVGFADADAILACYPFELSGGMCQRVMVAMGLLADADVLIADEPTASLDVTTQAAVLRELVRLRDAGMAIVLITHDLGVVAQTADDVYVMRDGRIVESGSVFEIFETPRHPYTRSLVASIL